MVILHYVWSDKTANHHSQVFNEAKVLASNNNIFRIVMMYVPLSPNCYVLSVKRSYMRLYIEISEPYLTMSDLEFRIDLV